MSHVEKVSLRVPRYAWTAGSTLASNWWAWVVESHSPFCLINEASADRRSGHPSGFHSTFFLLMLLAQRCTGFESGTSLFSSNSMNNWVDCQLICVKDTNIVTQVTKQTKNSKFNWWLIRNIFTFQDCYMYLLLLANTVVAHSTTTACLLVLCCWVTLICAFPLRSRSTADHCTVRSFQSKKCVEALAVSLLSLRSFCRVYCWVSS